MSSSVGESQEARKRKEMEPKSTKTKPSAPKPSAPKPSAPIVPKPSAPSAPKSSAPSAPKPSTPIVPKPSTPIVPKPSAPSTPKPSAPSAPKPSAPSAPVKRQKTQENTLVFVTEKGGEDGKTEVGKGIEERTEIFKRLTVDQLKDLCKRNNVLCSGVKKKSDFLDKLLAKPDVDVEYARSLFTNGKKHALQQKTKEKETLASASQTISADIKKKKNRGGIRMFRSACTVLRTRCVKCESCTVCGVSETSRMKVDACKDCAACLHTHDVFESIAEARGGIRPELDVFYDKGIKKFVQTETQFVFGGEGCTHVVGKLRKGVVVNLTLEEIEMCRESGLGFILPQNLDSLDKHMTEEGEYIVENDETTAEVNRRVQDTALDDVGEEDEGEEDEGEADEADEADEGEEDEEDE